MKKIVAWFHEVPEGVWVLVYLAQAAAAVYVGYALLTAVGH